MAKTKEQDDLFGLYGITEEAYTKSKDILPTFELGKLNVGSRVVLTFLDETPRKMNVANKYKKGEKTETSVISVYVDTVFNMGKDGVLIEVPMRMNYSLWLSSKSLALGILKVHKSVGTLKGQKVTLSIGTAEYKDFGENRCYSVVPSN